MSKRARAWNYSASQVYSFFAAIAVYLSVAVWGSITLARLFFPIRLETETWYLRSWMYFFLGAFRMQVEIKGRQKLHKNAPVILVSNHQSLFDIPAAFMINGVDHVRMVAKKELFAIPIFGWVLNRAHFIPVDRSSRNSGMAATLEMKKKLAKGICVWVAPEGTRSPNGDLKSFRKGSFSVAIDTGTTVQPILVWNSFLSCPKGSLLPRPGTKIVVEILDPIEPSHPSFADRSLLCEETRVRMEKALLNARKEHPAYFSV